MAATSRSVLERMLPRTMGPCSRSMTATSMPSSCLMVSMRDSPSSFVAPSSAKSFSRTHEMTALPSQIRFMRSMTSELSLRAAMLRR